MADVAAGRFAQTVARHRRVGIDTAAMIYHLEDVHPYSALTSFLLAEAAKGTIALVLSTIAVSEILAGPWRTGKAGAARRIEGLLRALPGAVVADVTWGAAAAAAELRGRTGLPLPDALIIASASQTGATLMVTNDAAWRAKRLPCQVAVLNEYAGS